MTTDRDAAWVVATTLGIAAALLGLEHGAFETAQGNVAPGGLVISAIGPPCEPSTAWHACEPALTVVPDVLVGGVAAMGVALLVLVWVVFGLTRKHGGDVLFLLTIVLFLVGGGFVTLLVGMVSAFAGTHIGSRHLWWRTHVPTGATRSLARLWPWLLSIYLGWAVG